MKSLIQDRWTRLDRATGKRVPTADHGQGSRWRARYFDPSGREQARRFAREVDAEQWIEAQRSGVIRGDHVSARDARTTVGQWCERWLDAYGSHKPSTVRQARVHVRQIVAEFGAVPLVDVKPSAVRSWVARLGRDGLAPSYVYALHRRLSQIMADAVHDGLIPRNPCSRRTSPAAGRPRPYVATTAQVWALHDAMPDHLRSAVLLGAFAGLRVAEVSALRTTDVDWLRGVIHPAVQWPAEGLKTECSRTAVPIPRELCTMLSTRAGTVVADQLGQPVGPWQIERAMRVARKRVDGLPDWFRFHDLRHYFASMLIASGLDVKVVQTRLRHASARTTLDVYGHLWPDSDDTSRAAVSAALGQRAASG
ncbi:site-specific integrase [Serinicoccus kebangsaanensis]|uniref:site-specific integrase n=1 Tax=Serinicoccus kebangsaanensis TaxID=2602069 RepID=UPI00124D5063|nr:site-specific integrase [Serinicoccus kebangsaanensis]